jgi:predicted ABC-class ATPase
MEQLRKLLHAIDRKGYKAYKRLEGRCYRFSGFTLSIDHVQGDPFATPSRVSIRVPMERAAYPPETWRTIERRVALEDFIGRRIAQVIGEVVKGRRGTGKSGEVHIAIGGQEVLLRNAIVLTDDWIEARLMVGLPADGRTILGREAHEMLFRELPPVVEQSMLYRNQPTEGVEEHVKSVEDQSFLRHWLHESGLVAFVADGSILPRLSGIDERPLPQGAVKFVAPDSLAYTVNLPNTGSIRGMGIPAGVTLIVGGGFHGKSTLLHALERAVQNFIPGDGRERVVTKADAFKVRAEDGRVINRVNISPFIDRLPLGRDTHSFSTDNASGSTSQAANIIEALECGSRLLLIDEDTSATNFMIRDARMQALVARDKEPITPFLHRVRELYERCGVSSIIVMGGSGDYFEVADTVIMMDSYRAYDVSERARSLAGSNLQNIFTDSHSALSTSASPRRPRPRTLDASRGRKAVKIEARDTTTLFYGRHTIDLSRVEQLADVGQTRAIGWMLHYFATHYAASTPNLVDGLQKVFDDVLKMGLDILLPYKVGNLALPRLHEVAAAINRIREHDWE